MTLFVGRYEHSLDAKGRVILPAKFRSAFEDGGFLSQHNEGCLALWTIDEFADKMLTMRAAAAAGSREERNLVRVWAAGSHEVEIDRNGRMPIPPHLREFAKLDGDVLINGAIERIELWSPEAWEERVKPSERQLTDA